MTKTQILVVDDEPDLLAELAPLLDRTGFSVITAGDGQQALSLGAVPEYLPDDGTGSARSCYIVPARPGVACINASSFYDAI